MFYKFAMASSLNFSFICFCCNLAKYIRFVSAVQFPLFSPQHSAISVGNDPRLSPKCGYGTIQMSTLTIFYDALDTLSPYGPINMSTYPITMEQIQ